MLQPTRHEITWFTPLACSRGDLGANVRSGRGAVRVMVMNQSCQAGMTAGFGGRLDRISYAPRKAQTAAQPPGRSKVRMH